MAKEKKYRLSEEELSTIANNIDVVFKFLSSLAPETDRGCALMAAAFLDHSLLELLKKNLVKNKRLIDKLTGPNQPLGSFSTRIDFAYALGLIEKSVHRDLNLIRKIRNDFAHVPEPIGFEEGSIQSRCRELALHTYGPKAKPRRIFTRVVSGLVAFIHTETMVSSNPKPKKDFVVTEEFKKNFDGLLKKLIDEIIQ